MFTKTPSAEKNLILLSVASALCGGVWAWAFIKAMVIDSYFPGDSRVGIALIPTYAALVMTAVFQLRVIRIVKYSISREIKLRPFSKRLVIALNLLSITSLVGTTLYEPFVWLGAATSFLFFPPGIIGIVVALISLHKDIEKDDQPSRRPD